MPQYRYFTDNQVAKLKEMMDERFAPGDTDGRAPFNGRFLTARSREDVQALFDAVKAAPTLREQAFQRRNAQAAAARANRPTEDGYYRNPETGELYRLSHGKNGEIVSKYSETGGPRRLLTSLDQIVNGSWKRVTGGFQVRRLLQQINKDWKIDVADLAKDYAYGFCPYHHGPLQDGVSVVLGYGPDCAKQLGLPWGPEAAQAVLAANRATAVTA